MLSAVAFGVLSFAIILGAIMMLNTENLLHGAYWFLWVALSTAGIIWFLGAEYVAIVQLLVYAGSAGVLLVFTLMVTARTRNELIKPVEGNIFAFLGAAAFLALIIYAILFSPALTVFAEPEYPSLVALGEAMFSLEGWVLPFELVSLVLTVALIGAVWWTRGSRPDKKKGGK